MTNEITDAQIDALEAKAKSMHPLDCFNIATGALLALIASLRKQKQGAGDDTGIKVTHDFSRFSPLR